jgi:Predicted transcriptional regulator
MDSIPTPATSPALQDDGLRLLKAPAVLDKIAISRSGMYLLIRQGEFPRPVRLLGRHVGWRSDEVDQWIRSRPPARTDSRRSVGK